MNDSRFAIKVGFFVCVTTVLVALLILTFSNGVTLFNSTYKLRVVLPNAAGLKPAADVMMAGVTIGKVTLMELADDGKSVDITVSILSRYKIRHDATFQIDSLGFLGDQYIEVSAPPDTGLAPTNEIVFLKPGETVVGVPTFNMTEAAKSISGVVEQARKTMKDLDQAITNVNNSALSTNTLAHFVGAITNLQVLTERVSGAASKAEELLTTNADNFHSAVANFQALSARLTNTEDKLDQIIVTNREDVRVMVTNLADASANFKKLSEDLQLGNGPVRSLLKDEEMTAELASALSNANMITSEFSLFGSNLNQKGIWAMLWKPKKVETKKAETNQPPVHFRRGR